MNEERSEPQRIHMTASGEVVTVELDDLGRQISVRIELLTTGGTYFHHGDQVVINWHGVMPKDGNLYTGEF